MLDILFLNPPSPNGEVYIRDINRSGRMSRERTIWPQTSLAYLASVMKREGYTVDIIDCIGEEMGWDEVKNILKGKKPRYVVVVAITSIITNDLYATYLAKTVGSKTIAVGSHITSLPVETLRRYPSLDYGIMGEPEVTINELVKSIDDGKDLSAVKGIVFRKGEDIYVTEKRPFIKDLDELPIPLHELLPISKYRLPYIGSNYTFVLASRGCPYSCTFCRQVIMWERVPRTRSAESILEELKYLDKIGVSNLVFHSDTFTLHRDIVMELCNLIVREGLRLRWCCNSRVDTVDEELLRNMKMAGCWMIMYGIENASQEILKNVKKGGNTTMQQARKAVIWAKKAGIKVWGYFVIGLPGETKYTIDETINFARSLPLDIVNFAVGTPYIGTEFYEQAKKNKWLESEDWEDFDQNYSAIVSYPGLTAQDIKKAIMKAYLKWYVRPRGMLAFLKGFSDVESVRTLFKIGIQHLRITREKQYGKSV